MRVYGTVVYSSKASEAMGQPDRVREVRVVARAKSKAAFVRALVAADLVEKSTASVLREVVETGNASELAACTTPDQVFITSINPSSRRTLIPWPPTA